MTQDTLKMAREPPKLASRAPHDGPRVAQEARKRAPKRPHEGSEREPRSQFGSEAPPGASWGPPGALSEPSRTHPGNDFVTNIGPPNAPTHDPTRPHTILRKRVVLRRNCPAPERLACYFGTVPVGALCTHDCCHALTHDGTHVWACDQKHESTHDCKAEHSGA